MKKILIFLHILALLFTVRQVYANHLLGGEIGYRFVSVTGNAQVYEVTLSFFADCSSAVPLGAYSALVNADPQIILYKGNTFSSSLRLHYDAAQSDIEITPVCPDEAGNTACININNPLPGIKKFVYKGSFTLNGTDDNWRFAFMGSITNSATSQTSAGRSFIIQNAEITDPALGTATVIYLEATLNNTASTNSSPTFTANPTPFFCLNKAATYSLGAADPENDALKFSLISGKSVSSDPPPDVVDVVYLPSFTAELPLPTAPGDFNFNTATGQMEFTPDQVKNCLVANLVEEFREGVKIGSSMREMTFVILDNCNNDAPLSPVSEIENASVNTGPTGDLTLSVCEGQTADIAFEVAATDPNGDNTTVTYSNLPEAALVTIDNNGSDNPVVHFVWNVMDAEPGNYIFYITYTDDGCPLVSTKTIAYTVKIIPHNHKFTGGSIASCVNTINGAAWAVPEPGVTLDYSYRWVDTTGTTLKDTNSTAGDTLRNIPPGIYKVYIRNAEGCGTNVTVMVTEIPLPEIHILTADTTLCAGLPVEISTFAQDNVNYLWNTGDTTCCIVAMDAGIYMLKATNHCGTVEDSVMINFVKCNYCLFIPNAFSPNGDGKNDKFNVLETCLIEKYKLQIFNRWGELVFTTLSTSNSWDGTYKGRVAESGVYYYVIDALPTDQSKGEIRLKGDITLIR